jgi:hypothetical protein
MKAADVMVRDGRVVGIVSRSNLIQALPPQSGSAK